MMNFSMIRGVASVAAVLAMLVTLPVAAQTPQTPAQAAVLAAKVGLTGTWALIRFENTDAKGQIERPFGEHPRGYFVYDATGHVNIQFARNPPPPKPVAEKATESELREALASHVAYFGTYRLDLEKQTVTHVVEGSLDAGYRNSEQVRPFTLNGDVLVITVTAPDGASGVRELHRVK